MSTPFPRLHYAAPVIPPAHLDDLRFQVAGTVCNLESRHCFISDL
jgi:hypothetical protein